MAWWTRSTKRRRGSVKAHVAKESGRRARREEDDRSIAEQTGEVAGVRHPMWVDPNR